MHWTSSAKDTERHERLRIGIGNRWHEQVCFHENMLIRYSLQVAQAPPTAADNPDAPGTWLLLGLVIILSP